MVIMMKKGGLLSIQRYIHIYHATTRSHVQQEIAINTRIYMVNVVMRGECVVDRICVWLSSYNHSAGVVVSMSTCCDGIAGIDKGCTYSDVISAVGAVVLIVRGYRDNTATS